MEDEGILNADNDTDIFCLHYVFIPRINKSLSSYREAWNNHPLSSEGNRSPLQLYTGGSLGNPLFDEQIDLASYGVDVEAISDEETEEEAGVVVPVVDLELSDGELQVLQANVNPLQACDDFGLQLYKDALGTVYHLMRQSA